LVSFVFFFFCFGFGECAGLRERRESGNGGFVMYLGRKKERGTWRMDGGMDG
jgi:DNA relaxase NicK